MIMLPFFKKVLTIIGTMNIAQCTWEEEKKDIEQQQQGDSTNSIEILMLFISFVCKQANLS